MVVMFEGEGWGRGMGDGDGGGGQVIRGERVGVFVPDLHHLRHLRIFASRPEYLVYLVEYIYFF